MKFRTRNSPGFTLIETVIAIGVLAVLLTGFMLVFTPAADGIRKAINIQLADRMASTLEFELGTLRSGESGNIVKTGFDKAYTFIEGSMSKPTPEVIFVYQYRGDLKKVRPDGTMGPYLDKDGVAGKDYAVVTMARRRITTSGNGTAEDSNFKADLSALESRVFAVKTTQLVFSGGQLVESSIVKIADPTPGEVLPTVPAGAGVSDGYPEAVIAFSASFYGLPSSSYDYLKKSGGKFDSSKLKNPYFTRNLAVRR